MQKDSETAFLKKRKGFIRVAMQCGSPIVPCFAFGQGGTYSWYRPGPPLLSEGFVQAMSRRMGEHGTVAYPATEAAAAAAAASH
jgi:2-acylglycerol O-acyltransferase 2